MIPGLYAEWLDMVATIPEADLPHTASTVAFTIRVALAYRAEAEAWQRLFDEEAVEDEAVS